MIKNEVGGLYRSLFDNITALRAFTAVVETGSFSEAGHKLKVVPSTISKHVSMLEDRIQGQLLLRSTKQFSVTELGRRLYERSLVILREVESTEVELGAYRAEPQGQLRVTAPPVFAYHHFSALIPRFLAQFPKVSLDLNLTAETVNLIDHAVDVAIRISSHLDPNLIAVKLAPNMRTICVAPAYVARHGQPARPEELAGHNCILTSSTASMAKWPIGEGAETSAVSVSGNLVVNNGEMYRRAILDGIGIGYSARFLVYDDIKCGRLIELFPSMRIVSSHIYAVYAERRNLPLKTRAFIDFVRDAFRTPPEWAV